MRPFKISTAVTIRIGPALDSTGAEYTGLVIGDLTLTKNGTSAAMAAAATLTHIANGHYSLVTIAGNTDTLGSLRIDCNKATYQIPPVEGEVLPATVFDALVTNAAGGANGLLLSLANNRVDLGQWLGVAPLALVSQRVSADATAISGDATAADNAESFFDGTGYAGTGNTIPNVTTVNGLAANVITAASIATDAIDSDAFAASAVTEIQSGLATAASISALNNLSQAQSQTAAEAALVTYHLDHLIAAADPGGVVANSSFLAKLVSKSATPAFASYDNTTDSLEANRDNIGTAGAGLTAIDLPDQTMNIIGNITGNLSGSVGSVTGAVGSVTAAITLPTIPVDWITSSGLAASAVTEIQSGLSTLDAAGVRSAVGLASANLDTQLDALPTAAENAAALLDLSSGIETSITPRQAIRGILAACIGLVTGAGTGTEVFKGGGQASGGTTRLTYTVDSSGNRSAVTLNL